MTTTIFTASDLDRKRREVLDAAKGGLVRVRDTDGAHLVMESARIHEAREAVAGWALRLHQLYQALDIPREQRRPRDFGDLTWARYLPEEQQHQMVEELFDALLTAHNEHNAEVLTSLAEDWILRAQAHNRAATFRELAAYGAGKAAEHGKKPGDAAAVVREARRRRASAT